MNLSVYFFDYLTPYLPKAGRLRMQDRLFDLFKKCFALSCTLSSELAPQYEMRLWTDALCKLFIDSVE